MTQLHERRAPDRVRPGGAATTIWLAQAVSGALLLLLVTVHMIANHFLAAHGLRTYAEVVAYVRNPFVFALEAAFLVTVTGHGLLGIRSVVLDRGPSARAVRRLDRVLLGLGAATIAYGLALLVLLATR